MITDKREAAHNGPSFFVAVFGLRSSVFRLRSSGFGLRLRSPSPGACHLPPATCNLSPATCQPGASHQPGPSVFCLQHLSSASVFSLRLQSPDTSRTPAGHQPGPSHMPPATCRSKVLHPHGVVVVVAHPPLGLYIRIF